MVFVSPRRGNVIGISSSNTITDNIVGFFDQLPSSSYLVFDSGYKYIYDKYITNIEMDKFRRIVSQFLPMILIFLFVKY